MTEAKDFKNPLLINVIAERVLQFVPVAHLKACRLVSRLWWKESLPRWRRTHWLQVSCYNLNTGRQESYLEERGRDEIQMRKCLHIDLYMSFWEDLLDPYELRTQPFQKLKLFKSQFAFESRENDELEKFLAQSGSAVKFLTLEKCTFESLEDFRKMVFRFSPYLEYLSLVDNIYKGVRPHKNQLNNLNLKTLVANESDVQFQLKYLKLSSPNLYEFQNEASPLTWTEFLAHLPNIQNLELENFYMRFDPDDEEEEDFTPINDIFGSIHALRRDCGILQRLTGLDVLNIRKRYLWRFEASLVEVLRRIFLPLTFLAIDIGFQYESDSDDSDDDWYHDDLDHDPSDVLKIAPATLETLVIFKGPYSQPFGSFPFGIRLPNLTKLTLIGPIVNDLHFLEQIPTLKILRIFHKIDFTGKGQEGTIPLPKAMDQIQEIQKVDDYIDSLMQMSKVAEVDVVRRTDFSKMSHLSFPNIEECLFGEQGCSSSHVEQLARLMPNLKRLRIGVCEEGFRAICKYWKGLEALDILTAYMVTEQGITGIVPGEETRLPNITDLKYLRAFGMCCLTTGTKIDARFSEITDLSLEQGLLQLKYLESVAVWCSDDKMSDENYKKFKSMFPPFPYSAIHRDKTCDDSDDLW